MAVAAAVAGGSSWTDIMTAFGTVGAVIAAVGIALWAEWRSGRRLRAEQEHSDKMLAEERQRSSAALEDERAFSRAQLQEERTLARSLEQRAEAYQVQVVLAHSTVDGPADLAGDPDHSVRHLAAMVVNHGNYTITGVDAKFVFSKVTRPVEPQRTEYFSGFVDLPPALRREWTASPAYAMQDVLTPRGTAIRFVSPAVPDRALADPFPVVQWTDYRGTRWEHKRGVVRPVREDEPWEP